MKMFFNSFEEFESYPWPEFERADWSFLGPQISEIHDNGCAAQIWMECTIWQTAWYLRCMDLLMTNMAMQYHFSAKLIRK